MALKIVILVAIGILLTYCGIMGFCLIFHDHTVAGKAYIAQQEEYEARYARTLDSLSKASTARNKLFLATYSFSDNSFHWYLRYQHARHLNEESRCWIGKTFFDTALETLIPGVCVFVIFFVVLIRTDPK